MCGLGITDTGCLRGRSHLMGCSEMRDDTKGRRTKGSLRREIVYKEIPEDMKIGNRSYVPTGTERKSKRTRTDKTADKRDWGKEGRLRVVAGGKLARKCQERHDRIEPGHHRTTLQRNWTILLLQKWSCLANYSLEIPVGDQSLRRSELLS